MRFLIPLAGLVLSAACAAGGSGNAASPRSNRDLIVRSQIEQMSVQDAYEIVQRLRPEYLREQRGAASINRTSPLLAVVYIDGVKRGGPDTLRGLRPVEVEEIRFMSGTDATTRYGTDHGGGVIEVKSRHGR
jgi:hypothetical protein